MVVRRRRSEAAVSHVVVNDTAAGDSAAHEPATAVHTRRELLESALALLGVAAISGFAATRALADEARSSSTWRYFSSGEAATLDALVAQIIPSDDTPGAREMGVARFIDHAGNGRRPVGSDHRETGLQLRHLVDMAHPRVKQALSERRSTNFTNGS